MKRTPALRDGKATVLMALAGSLRSARIPASVLIPWTEWNRNRDVALARALLLDGEEGLAVRSARFNEDRILDDAGRYLSLLRVPASRAQLSESIDLVFASYGRIDEEDGVLVQPQIAGVRRALVASTRGAWGSAYQTISVATGPAPDAITRGDTPAETWHLLPDVDHANLPAPVVRALDVLHELCGLFHSEPFEVELVDDGASIWLLQVRALPGDRNAKLPPGVLTTATSELGKIRQDGATLLGLMPDWNTAELLGAHPRPLALSLFRAIVGDGTWWDARSTLGYARPYADQLIQPVAGRPYVDVRASFESLCPAALPESSRQKLVDACINKLRSQPSLHDRVEFEVVLSGLEFDTAARLDALNCEVDGAELLPALRQITVNALDRSALKNTTSAFTALIASPDLDTDPLPERLRSLTRNVALPFARVARCDFLAQSLWRSAARRGAIAPKRCLAMLADASATNFDHFSGVNRAARPSQFDIRSLMAAPVEVSRYPDIHANKFELSTQESSAITGLLREQMLPWSADELVDLARCAARAREIGKRALAALLGDWLTDVRHLAMQRGIDIESLSWLSWQDAINQDLSKTEVAGNVEQARQRHGMDSKMKMPMLLADEQDLRGVHTPPAIGHFHGNGVVEASLCFLDAQSSHLDLPSGSIVAIASADPGFEWIFSRRPKALITAFGGPHSHMALRCADLGCGVVLGLGIERFDRLIHTTQLRIDFDHAHIQAVSGHGEKQRQRVA